MTRKVTFSDDVNDTKCWREGTKHPCRFLRSRSLGMKHWCCMFGDLIDNDKGWPYRHNDCIERFGGVHWRDAK